MGGDEGTLFVDRVEFRASVGIVVNPKHIIAETALGDTAAFPNFEGFDVGGGC